MRNLFKMGTLGAGFMGLALTAGAAETTYNISGQLVGVHNICFNVALSLTGDECSYARTRLPTLTGGTFGWSGPILGSAFYAQGSIGDNLAYQPQPGDDKLNVPLSGAVIIDDNGTPDDGSDDLISGTFAFGAAVFNASTGQGRRALERWDSWTHTMAPTPVTTAVAQVGGGFEYVIGLRGKPTPNPLFIAGSPGDVFPSENAHDTLDPGTWDTTAANTEPASARIGIERSRAFALGSPDGRGNVGATTTAVFEGYGCEDSNGYDCDGISATQTSSATLFGFNRGDGDDFPPPYAGSNPALPVRDEDAVPLGPGFSNLILIVKTNGVDAITDAQAYWTREYIIRTAPTVEGDAANPNQFNINNSWGGGRFTFTGSLSQDAPTAVDDVATAAQDVTTNIAVLLNDTFGSPDPNTLSVETPPANGTVVAGTSTMNYTPALGFSGTDEFWYRLTDGDGDFSVARVTVTVPNKVPTAGNFTASSSGGNPTAAINVLAAPTVLGTGGAANHTVTIATQGSFGTCAVVGSNSVQFTPTAGAGNGTNVCTYQITDFDGDTSTGNLTVSVSGNTSSGDGGGVSGPQLPGGSGSLDLLTLAALLAGLPLIARRRRRL